jgi:hypothetical protein
MLSQAAQREILLEHEPEHRNGRTVGRYRQRDRGLRGSINVGKQGRLVNLAADELPGPRPELSHEDVIVAGAGNCESKVINQSLRSERMKRSISGKYSWK